MIVLRGYYNVIGGARLDEEAYLGALNGDGRSSGIENYGEELIAEAFFTIVVGVDSANDGVPQLEAAVGPPSSRPTCACGGGPSAPSAYPSHIYARLDVGELKLDFCLKRVYWKNLVRRRQTSASWARRA